VLINCLLFLIRQIKQIQYRNLLWNSGYIFFSGQGLPSMLKPVNSLPGEIYRIHIYMKYNPITHFLHPLNRTYVPIVSKQKFAVKKIHSPNNNKKLSIT